jgi:hypothetical protein
MAIDTAIFDIETLGSRASAVVLSVGAVVVDSTIDYEYDDLIKNGFYVTLDVASQVESGRKIEKETLDWWGTQGKDAMSVLAPSSDDIHWRELLPAIFEYFEKNSVNVKTIKVYARGSHFDFGIMHDLFRVTGDAGAYDLPWRWWNIHDSKTVQITLSDKKVDVKPEGFIHHHALHDAAREYMNIQLVIYNFQKTLENL